MARFVCDAILHNSLDFVARLKLCTSGPPTVSQDVIGCYFMTAIAITITMELKMYIAFDNMDSHAVL